MLIMSLDNICFCYFDNYAYSPLRALFPYLSLISPGTCFLVFLSRRIYDCPFLFRHSSPAMLITLGFPLSKTESQFSSVFF